MASGSKIFAVDYARFLQTEHTEWLYGTRCIILRSGEELSLKAYKLRCRAEKEIELPFRTLEKGLATLQELVGFLVRFSDELEQTSSDRRQKLRGMEEAFDDGPWTQIIPSKLSRADYEGVVDIYMRLSRRGIFRVASLDNVYAAVSEDITLCRGVLTSCATSLQIVNRERRNEPSEYSLERTANELAGKIALVAERLQKSGLSLNAMYLKASTRWQAIQEHIQNVHLNMNQSDNYLAMQIKEVLRLQEDHPEEWDANTAEEILYGPYCVLLKDSASFYEKHWRTLRRLGLELNDPDAVEKGLPVLSGN